MKKILISSVSTIIAILGSRYLFDCELNGILVLAIYFAIYAAMYLRQVKIEFKEENSKPNSSKYNWPISGIFKNPNKKFGGTAFLIIFFISNFLSLFNPFQLKQMIQQYFGNIKLKQKNKHKVLFSNKCVNKYSLPFNGKWLVYNGGIRPETSHSWSIYGQRYAYDFVKVNQNHERHTGKGLKLSDYFCYGEDILAVADGEIVGIDNSISDAPFVGYGFCDFSAKSFIGNYVVIKHLNNEYSVYAHLIKGSISVSSGQKVRKGEVIGKCGHSGHSTEPHLHFHIQDSGDFFNGSSIPIKFERIKINSKEVESSFIEVGDQVENI